MFARRTRTLRAACLASLAPAAALAVAGCGETSASKFTGESHAVAQEIANFQSHASADDHQTICQKDLSQALRRKLEAGPGGCSKALEEQLKDVEVFTLTIESVSVHGASASAVVKSTYSGKLALSTLTLLKEGSGWRISGLS